MKPSGPTITVKIGSMTYRLRADRDARVIRATAAEADRWLSDIEATYPELSPSTATVLAFVNALDGLKRSEQARCHAEHALHEAQNALHALTEERNALLETCFDLKKALMLRAQEAQVQGDRADGDETIATGAKDDARRTGQDVHVLASDTYAWGGSR